MRPRGRVEVGQEQQRGVLEHGAEIRAFAPRK